MVVGHQLPSTGLPKMVLLPQLITHTPEETEIAKPHQVLTRSEVPKESLVTKPPYKVLSLNAQFQSVLMPTTGHHTEAVSSATVEPLLTMLLPHSVLTLQVIGRSRIHGELTGVSQATSDLLLEIPVQFSIKLFLQYEGLLCTIQNHRNLIILLFK